MNLPSRYGPYLLLERISVGGMAEVYKAKEYGVDGFERTVAVKRILPHVAEDDEFIAMFKDEAKIAVQLNHGNIAQIYNLGNENDSFYIALEYVAGRDLRTIFQRCQNAGEPVPVAQACYIIMKICEGLDYAHNKKDKYNRPLSIVHRDVSPPNLLVSFEGEVKLIDFGVAKAAGRASRTQAGILKGKFGYMSPEQVRGMPLDRRSDVFSVGVVLFEVLCGRRLFQAETDFATLEKVRAVDVPAPSSVNPNIVKPLEDIIFKALTREPEQRYQSAIELHDELQAFMFAQGLFYSRKDLAAWMREHYAPEIEAEKEKQAQQADLRLEQFSGPTPARTTLSPLTGGVRPPPPPPRSRPLVPPPLGPRRSPGDGKKSPKRKTMVMTTSRKLPPPPGGSARAHANPDQFSRPTPPDLPRVPPDESGGSAIRARHSTDSAVPRATDSAVPPVADVHERPTAPPGRESYETRPLSADFDWDDDELETRLFEGDDDHANESDEGRRAMLARRPTRVEPSAGSGTEPSGIDPRAARGATVVPPQDAVAPPIIAGTPMMSSGSSAAIGSHQGGLSGIGPMGFANPGSGSNPSHPSGPGLAGGLSSPSMVGPMPNGMGMDYDDMPRRSKLGPIIVIVLALLVLFGVAFAFIWIRLNDPSGEAGAGGSIDGQLSSVGSSVAASALTVQVIPSDAKVSVDGKSLSGSSPFVTSVTPGPHLIKIEHPRYMFFETELTVPSAGLSVPPITLQPKVVTLALKLSPAHAKAVLRTDGKLNGSGTDGDELQLVRETDVEQVLEVSAPGYTTSRQVVTFTGESTQTVSVSLSKASVESTPAAVSSKNDDASPKKSRPSRKSPSKPKAQEKTATLRIGSDAGQLPAKVYIDGKFVGQTPILKLAVTPGSHTIKFAWDSGQPSKSKSITLSDGETKTVKP